MPLIETSSLLAASPTAVLACLRRADSWAMATSGRLTIAAAGPLLDRGQTAHIDLHLGRDHHRYDGVVAVSTRDRIEIRASQGGQGCHVFARVREDRSGARLRVGIETGSFGTVSGSFREQQRVHALQEIVEDVIVGVAERTAASQLVATIDLRDHDVVA